MLTQDQLNVFKAEALTTLLDAMGSADTEQLGRFMNELRDMSPKAADAISYEFDSHIEMSKQD